ncbi:MAG TPA: matrixin family metalloprotease [Polyangiaceae bacterium]|nr:matrixin family metalloprotease [Polyangiaceae bacterium]
MRSWIVGAVALAGVITATLTSTDARAFCRTTTVHAPSGYDPSQSGCWTQGTPLAWPSGQTVPYSLASNASKQIDLADATAIAHEAFAQWDDAPCKEGAPTVQAYDNGPVDAALVATDCGLNQCDPTVHDGLHMIVFRDDQWPHSDPVNTLALTTVTYGIETGTIFDADIEVNTAQHTITAMDPPSPGTVALRAILTHEAGHFFGLAHATDTSSIMFWQYQPGAIDLTADDIGGVCAVYTPTKAKDGCGVTPGGGGGAAGMFGVALFMWGALARRRRTS